MQKLDVQNIYGMNIASLITAVTALKTYFTSMEQKATKFPLFKSYYADKIKYTNHIKGPNTFKSLRFYEDPLNSATLFFYDLASD